MQALRVSPRPERHSLVSTTSPGPLNSFATKFIPYRSRRATSAVSHQRPDQTPLGDEWTTGQQLVRGHHGDAVAVMFDVMLVQCPHEVGFFSLVAGESAITRPATFSVTLAQLVSGTISWFRQETQHFTFWRTNYFNIEFHLLAIKYRIRRSFRY